MVISGMALLQRENSGSDRVDSVFPLVERKTMFLSSETFTKVSLTLVGNGWILKALKISWGLRGMRTCMEFRCNVAVSRG